MRRVVVDMQNALFADAIATALRNFDPGFEVHQSESPAKTTDMCVFTEANILPNCNNKLSIFYVRSPSI